MKKFVATELRTDGEYGVQFEAKDWTAAEIHCEREGLTLLGEVAANIPLTNEFGPDEADALVDIMNQAEQSTKQ